MKRRGVLFDLDGVLIDSERLYSEFYDGIAELYDTGEENFSLAIKGSTIEKILAKYFPSPEASADVLERINRFEAEMQYPICEGVIEFITELKNRNIPMAIVTSSSENKMQRLYAQHPELPEYFDAIVTGSDVTKSKPDPESYIIGAERIGCNPEDCFVFEDSISGLAAGMASGATVIGLATKLPADKLQGKAHELIDSFAGFTVDAMLSIVK